VSILNRIEQLERQRSICQRGRIAASPLESHAICPKKSRHNHHKQSADSVCAYGCAWQPRDVRLLVPAVDGAVVARVLESALATEVEGQILRDAAAAAEAVVQVDASARPVKAQVPLESRLARLGLKHCSHR
jgi:hypothetical protein